MPSIKRSISTLAIVSVCGGLAACGGSGAESGGSDGEATSLKIGFVGSLTGPFAPSGKNSLAGLQAGAEYLKAKNPDLDIEIVSRDTKGETTAAVAATRELSQQGVSAMYFTTEAFPAVQNVLNQVKVPGNTAGGIAAVLKDVGDSKRYKWAFSTGAGTAGPTSVRPLLEYAAQQGSPVAVLDDSTAFNTAQVEETEVEQQADFPDIKLVKQSFPTDAQNVTAQLTKLRDSGAKSLVMWSYGAPLVAAMKSLNRLGWNPQMSAVLGLGDPETAKQLPKGMRETTAAGPIAKTFLADAPGQKPTGITAEFLDRYLEKQGLTEFDALDAVGAVSFDWALLVQQAAERAGSSDPQKVKDELISGEPFEGANGTYRFGPDERIGIGADQLGMFLPAESCASGRCVAAPTGGAAR